jgi:hypothetical protein
MVVEEGEVTLLALGAPRPLGAMIVWEPETGRDSDRRCRHTRRRFLVGILVAYPDIVGVRVILEDHAGECRAYRVPRFGRSLGDDEGNPQVADRQPGFTPAQPRDVSTK